MKPGTIIKLPDHRIGTIVYHGLDGYGIVWGRIEVDKIKILSTCGLFGESPKDYPYFPEAMLREPYGNQDLECVGKNYQIWDNKKGEWGRND